MALSSITHSVIGAYLPLSMQILHGVSDEAAGYAVTGLAFSWTVASMVTSHIHGAAAMRSSHTISGRSMSEYSSVYGSAINRSCRLGSG